MICRNHSNLFQTSFLSSLLQFTKSIILVVLLFIMKKNKGEIIPSITQQTQPLLSELDESPFARFRPLLILPRTTRKKFEGTTGQSFYLEGGDCMDVHGSFHKSLKTHFDWSESLALSCELLKLGYDWLFRSQTTGQTTDNHI